MEECYICFSNYEPSKIKSLPCCHTLCFSCYLKLDKQKCPLCRKEFDYNKDDIIKRNKLGIQNKYDSPSIQQNYIDRSRINDLNNFNDINDLNNLNNFNEIIYNQGLRIYNIEIEYIGLIERQRHRKRRKNLTEEEIIEKRKIIREKCKRKWMIKENRLSKIKWYDINL